MVGGERRWACGVESQPLDRAEQGCLIGKGEVRRKARKLLLRDRFAEQDPGVATVALARTLRGRGAVAAVTQLDRLPAPGRRWARARLG